MPHYFCGGWDAKFYVRGLVGDNAFPRSVSTSALCHFRSVSFTGGVFVGGRMVENAAIRMRWSTWEDVECCFNVVLLGKVEQLQARIALNKEKYTEYDELYV